MQSLKQLLKWRFKLWMSAGEQLWREGGGSMKEGRRMLVWDAHQTKFKLIQLEYFDCLSVHHTPSLDEGSPGNNFSQVSLSSWDRWILKEVTVGSGRWMSSPRWTPSPSLTGGIYLTVIYFVSPNFRPLLGSHTGHEKWSRDLLSLVLLSPGPLANVGSHLSSSKLATAGYSNISLKSSFSFISQF